MAKKQMARAAQGGPGTVNVGENVTVRSEGGKTIIEIAESHRGGVSPSGKTIRVASTLGNVKLPNGLTLGLNAYVPNPDRA